MGFASKALGSLGVTLGAKSKQRGLGKQYEAQRQGAINAGNEINAATGRITDIYAPYRNLSQQLLPLLQQSAPVTTKLATASEFLPSYYQSSEYNTLNNAAMDDVLRNRSATGLRTGGTTVDLARIAPTLGLQALQRENDTRTAQAQLDQQRFNNLYNSVNLGYNAENNLADVYGRQGSSLAGLQTYKGEAKGAYKRGWWDAEGRMHEDLASIWGS